MPNGPPKTHHITTTALTKTTATTLVRYFPASPLLVSFSPYVAAELNVGHAIPTWDLELMTTLRIGIEYAF